MQTSPDSSSPWAEMLTPARGQLTTRRVSATGKWDLWWAIDVDRKPTLILQLSDKALGAELRLPNLAGINVQLQESGGQRQLRLQLLDIDDEELFHQLCLDLAAATEQETEESHALKAAIYRTWRWHYLLTRGRSQLLSEEEQKGLIGELLTIRDLLLPHIGPDASSRAWTGPDGTPKDFELGPVCIECKARRGAANARIEISSEDQLDTTHIDRLFLVVTDLHRAVNAQNKGQTIIEVAESVLQHFRAVDQMDNYWSLLGKLASKGIQLGDDYQDFVWIVGDIAYFDVAAEFPRLQTTSIPLGIDQVRYHIRLSSIEDFAIGIDSIVSRIQGDMGGHL